MNPLNLSDFVKPYKIINKKGLFYGMWILKDNTIDFVYSFVT